MVGPQAATVFVNVSNLAWFGRWLVQDQHLQFSQMRAIEFQRPVIRSTNTGATAVVDHRGHVTARLPPLTTGVLEATVEGRLGETPYARWLALCGLWPLIAAALAIVGLSRVHRAPLAGADSTPPLKSAAARAAASRPRLRPPPGPPPMLTFQQIILRLQQYWDAQGCALLQPYDMEVGAGTSHTATFLRALGPEPWKAAYVQPSRRPKDGRYGDNPNRLQHYYQYQVVLKPAPSNILELYLGSLEALGFDLKANDVRFVEDDWENPTLGAWGLGWEVWLNGMEVTQFTYFQQVGGIDCQPITGEITYGLERLAMYLQGVDNVYDLTWTVGADGQRISYGDVYLQNEQEQCAYNFEHSDVEFLLGAFGGHEKQAKHLIEQQLALPAYEQVLKAAHTFNLLDARGAISVTERAAYIGRIRNLARAVAASYLDSRARLGLPDGAREPGPMK